MAKRGADGRNDHRIACIDRLPWLVIHPGARASRPHPYSCKQPAICGHSLARRTKPAFTGALPSCRSLCGRDARAPGWVFVRAGRPRSRVGFVRARRPRSRVGVTPSPRPTLGGSLSSILQRLSGPLAVLRGPSWISFFVSWCASRMPLVGPLRVLTLQLRHDLPGYLTAPVGLAGRQGDGGHHRMAAAAVALADAGQVVAPAGWGSRGSSPPRPWCAPGAASG